MTTPADALLQAILEHPDDDFPRLVYADWLEDHGDPDRAEFIRVQIELAKLDEDDKAAPQHQPKVRSVPGWRCGFFVDWRRELR